jgi:hypothetical protein
MDNTQQTPASAGPGAEGRLTYDEHVQQIPASRQTAHRWLVRLVVVAIAVVLGLFVYAIYASFAWKSVGEANVVLAWLYFILAAATAALLLGVDTLLVGATLPLPFEASKYSYETGRPAVQSGWQLSGLGALVIVLALVGVAAVRAGRFGLEDWITVVVGFWVLVGLASAVLAILRRILRSR